MVEGGFKFSLTRIDPDWVLNRRVIVDQSRYFKKLCAHQQPEDLLKLVQADDFLAQEEDGLVTLRIPTNLGESGGFQFSPRGRKYIGQGVGDDLSQTGNILSEKSKVDQLGGSNKVLPGIDYFEMRVPLDYLMDGAWGNFELPNLKPDYLSHFAPNQQEVKETSRLPIPTSIDYKRTYLQAMRTAAKRFGRPTPVRVTQEDIVRKIHVPASPDDNSLLIFAGSRSSLVEPRVLVLQRFFERYSKVHFHHYFAQVAKRYIAWSDRAQEVDPRGFWQILPSATNRILPALQSINSMVERWYPSTEWNINIFLLSEGGNFSETDRSEIVATVRRLLSKGISDINYVEFLHPTVAEGGSRLLNMLYNDLRDLINKGLGLYQIKNLADLQKEMSRMFSGHSSVVG